MNEVKEFLKVLSQDQKAQALLRQEREPASAEEAAARYAAIAEKLGFSLPEEQMLAFLKEQEERQKKLTAETAEQFEKAALSEDALDEVAGGKGDDACTETFDAGEWCWFADSCSYVINLYDGTVKMPPLSAGDLQVDSDISEPKKRLSITASNIKQ